MLLADCNGGLDVSRSDGQNIDSDDRHSFNGLAKTSELFDFLGTPLHAGGDAGVWPTKRRTRFERHQAVGDIAQDLRRSKPSQVMAFDALQ